MHSYTTPHERGDPVRLKIRHNMEMAHRLSLDTGKCQQIHGHGMQVELVLLVSEGSDGMAVDSHGNKLEFGRLKRTFRNHIDATYDHHLVLNREDPWAGLLNVSDDKDVIDWLQLPGLVCVPGDPTVENLAKWIAEWACNEFHVDVICRIDETKTNGAEAMYQWSGFEAKFAKGAR
jgi:6-pyruvoyl-tetrahydropterin synthase